MASFALNSFHRADGVKMGRKVQFVSLGCARNLVDTEVMIAAVMERGFELAVDTPKADFVVINTCGFLKEAKEEAYAEINRIFSAKKKSAKVVVAGCMVKGEKEALKRRFPRIHYFLGSGDVGKIVDAIASKDGGESISKERSYLQQIGEGRALSTNGSYAYLKIAEGCAKRCSFCIIPTIKGPLKSKTIEQVRREFSSLLDQGVFEVVLIAQDLGDFGKDRKEKGALERLLKELIKERRPFWLRLLYLYPDEITEELITVMQSDPRICPYLDMPIQHVSDPILKAMRRKISKEQIVEVIQTLRRKIPDVVIRTSLMVGFPTESEEQFQELLSFVQEHSLDNVGVFEYSQEEGALASKMAGQVDEGLKRRRSQALMRVQQQVAKKRWSRFVGKKVDVLVEGYHPDSNLLLQGRFYGQCPEVDGCVILNDWERVDAFGKLYTVEITEAQDYDLIGRVLAQYTQTISKVGL